MPKFTVTLMGTLKFTKEIDVYADNECNAESIAIEVLAEGVHINDQMDIEDVEIKPFQERDQEFEIIARQKVNE